jgi:hypothetical protein
MSDSVIETKPGESRRVGRTNRRTKAQLHLNDCCARRPSALGFSKNMLNHTDEAIVNVGHFPTTWGASECRLTQRHRRNGAAHPAQFEVVANPRSRAAAFGESKVEGMSKQWNELLAVIDRADPGLHDSAHPGQHCSSACMRESVRRERTRNVLGVVRDAQGNRPLQR